MTEEELEAEREGQIARGETPRYAGNHRDLTEAQVKEFEAEDVFQVFVSAYQLTVITHLKIL